MIVKVCMFVRKCDERIGVKVEIERISIWQPFTPESKREKVTSFDER